MKLRVEINGFGPATLAACRKVFYLNYRSRVDERSNVIASVSRGHGLEAPCEFVPGYATPPPLSDALLDSLQVESNGAHASGQQLEYATLDLRRKVSCP